MKVEVTERTDDVKGHVVKLTKGENATMRYILTLNEGFLMVNPFQDPRTSSIHTTTWEDGLKAAINSVDF